ncbi:MAG: DUF421 domain-containing protein [Acidimicrobiia bacterium]|nr:DUF421 domain-containing protein [Acidimicrobiia bacterium]
MGLVLVAAHTAAIFAFLIVALRTFGRGALPQLRVADLAVILLLGSAIETAMVAGDTSLAAGLVSAGTLLALNALLGRVLFRSPRLRHLIGGAPLLLVHDGRVLPGHLRRAGMSVADLDEALRERGECAVADLREAVLEPDGSVNVVPR